MKNRTVRKIFPVMLSIALAVLFSFVSFAADDPQELPSNYDVNFLPMSVGFGIESLRLYTQYGGVSINSNYSIQDNYFIFNNATTGSYTYEGSVRQDVRQLSVHVNNFTTSFVNNKYFSIRLYYPSVLPVTDIYTLLSQVYYSTSATTVYYVSLFYKLNVEENYIELFSVEPLSNFYSRDLRINTYLSNIPEFFNSAVVGDFKVGVSFSDEPLYSLPVDEQINGKLSAIINDMNNGFSSMLESLDSVIDGLSQIQSNLDWLIYNVCNNIYNLSASQNTVVIGDNTYTLTSYQHSSFSISDEHVQQTNTLRYGTYLGILYRKIYEFFVYFRNEAELTFQWFYPLKSSNPQYWRAYNTDTDSYDAVNPSGVTGYITWYLGKLYEHLTADIDSVLETPVENTKQAIADLEQAENNIKSEYLPKLQAFNPDSSNIGTLAALPYFTNYLQRIFSALGAFNIPIIAALTLGICMQLIGYFKYKE